MPPKKATIKFVCSDKKLKQGEIKDSAGRCFKKGLRAGFVAGLQRARKNQARIAPVLQQIRQMPRLRPTRPNVQEMVPMVPQAQVERPSLKELLKNRPRLANGKFVNNPRDFLLSLNIRNPDFQIGGRRHRTRSQVRKMTPDELRTYILSTGEFRE